MNDKRTETDLSMELEQQIWSYINLQQGVDISIAGYIKHLSESYSD